MLLLALGIATYAGANLFIPGFRPVFVQNLYVRAPTATFLHLSGGLIALVVGAFQVNSGLRTQYLSLHRVLGRIYVVAVLVGGVAGLVLAVGSFGGLAAHFGFGLLAVCWIVTTLTAYGHIRAGNVAAHRAWMLRSYALTLAGVSLRVYLGISELAGVAFADFYPAVAWLCWVPNLLIVEWAVLTRGRLQAGQGLMRPSGAG